MTEERLLRPKESDLASIGSTGTGRPRESCKDKCPSGGVVSGGNRNVSASSVKYIGQLELSMCNL